MARRFVIDSAGNKYPFSRGVLVRSLTRAGLSIEEAYAVADQTAQRFKGTATTDQLSNIVYDILKENFGRAVAGRYRKLISEKEILVCESEGKTFVPFSRGILAGSIRSAGVDVQEAFEIARDVAEHFQRKARFRVTRSEIREVTAKLIRKRLGREYARRYLFWRQTKELDMPIVILIGGATGVGKSRLAAELAGVLEINRMASTDSIREVMRRMVSKELVPSIHVSSYEAGGVIYRYGEMDNDSKVLYGFLDQVEKVLTGVEAVIQRAIKENVSIIIEGIHLIPGILEEFKSKAHMVHIVLTTLDKEMHRSRFTTREKLSQRASRRYLKNFKAIRFIQTYIYKLAKEKGTPVVENIDFDQTRDRALEIITDELIELVKSRSGK
jgi:2-phosphoglycerate kinase